MRYDDARGAGRDRNGFPGRGAREGFGRGGFARDGAPEGRARRGEFPAGPEGFGPRGFGPGGFGGPGGPGGFGPEGGPERRGHGGRGGRRGPRGDVRGAVLTLLAEQPMHGYQIIQEIAERSGGLWQPSAGAVYPALSLLEDEGLVTITAEGGRKLARLTEAGTAHVAERAEEIGDPFTPMGGPGRRAGFALREKVREVGGAAMQIARNGSEAQSRAAVELLERTRQELYLVLAQPAAPTTDAHADADADADAPTEA